MVLANNLRFAARRLRKHPLFSGVVVLSLGLAIGANSALFSIIDAALFRPFDVREPERLISIYSTDSAGRGFQTSSYPDFTALRETLPGVTGVMGHSGLMTTITGGKPEVVFGEIVTGNYFAVSGARIALGRAFLPDEDRIPGAAPVVVISDHLWHRRFHADSSIVGRAITLNGHPFTVVGVAGPEFTGMLFRGLNSELWAPVMMMGQLRTDQLANRDEHWMFVKARLAAGSSLDQVSRSLGTVGTRLAAAFPASNRGRTFVARPTADVLVNPDGDRAVLPAAVIVLVVAGFVVVIAATNVANVMFARTASREREIAIRLALGASRRQIVAQLLAEGGLLALFGGVLGLALAFLFAQLLVAFHPPIPVPISLHVGMDAPIIAFTGATTCLAAVVFGLLPAWQASRPSLTGALTSARSIRTMRSGVMRLRRAFLVPQLTLSLVLLLVAGLFARSVMNAGAVDPGFDVDRTALLALSLNLDGYDSVRAETFYRELRRRIGASAGVSSITVTDRIPLDLYGSQTGSFVLSPSTGGDRVARAIQTSRVDASYFRTLGVPIVHGRSLTEVDVREQRPFAVISDAMARRYWPNGNALGQRLEREGGASLEIVGVARDTKVQTLGEAPEPMIYLPLDRGYAHLLRVIVRSSTSPSVVIAAVRREVVALDPGVAIFESGTMAEHVGTMLFPYRAAAWLSALLGGFGLLLSSIGLFGVVAFAVARRTREFGIRMALGETPRGIVAMVLAEQTRIIALAMAIGLALGLGVARLLAGVVFGISWSDPITIVAVLMALAGVAVVASYLPAARASRLSPSAALREE
jgi:putative ABC transport system permease protein